MSNSAFPDAMTRIAGQAEAQREHERKEAVREEQRRVVLGRARSVFVFLLIATLFVFGFHYRLEIQHLIISSEPATATQTETSVSAVLEGAREQSAGRDAALNELAR